MQPESHLHTAPSYNAFNLAASNGQYWRLADSQIMSWDNVAVRILFFHDIYSQLKLSQLQEPTTEIGALSELFNTYHFDTSQPDETPNSFSPTMEWNDASYPLYAPQHHSVTGYGPLPSWETQYPNYSQGPVSTFSSTTNDLVNSAQATPSQADLQGNRPAPYAEGYLLDIEPQEGDALSIHIRIPPSIPGAMYYDNHLMSEFSQAADGTIDVRVHLPAGYAHVSNTFVHA